ncbi:MAG: hypothetical protein L0Y76_12175 [Ignavibacteria bacterium]|nr:hypothetical protein [Ignavibacteria bacterium]
MLKKRLNVLLLCAGAALFTSQCSEQSYTPYEEYYVQIINKSNQDITNFYLGMNGSDEKFEAAKITKQDDAYCVVFRLPILKTEAPRSWGDYWGYYDLFESRYDIFIYNFDHKFKPAIVLTINSEDYQTVFLNSCEDSGCF